MRAAYLTALFICCTAFAVASNISSATATDGTLTNASSVVDNMQSSQLSGITVINGVNVNVSTTVTATFAGGGSASCVFVGNSCSIASNGGTISFSAGIGDTIASQWSITNSSTTTINSVMFNMAGAAFNPCFSGGAPTTTRGFCASNNFRGTATGFGQSISGDGLGGISGSVAYTNGLRASGTTTPIGDLYTQVTLSFNNFSTGIFNFYADTDLFVANPEPTTISLVGLALLGLGLVARRRG